jgi:hypothetical protein
MIEQKRNVALILSGVKSLIYIYIYIYAMTSNTQVVNFTLIPCASDDVIEAWKKMQTRFRDILQECQTFFDHVRTQCNHPSNRSMRCLRRAESGLCDKRFLAENKNKQIRFDEASLFGWDLRRNKDSIVLVFFDASPDDRWEYERIRDLTNAVMYTFADMMHDVAKEDEALNDIVVDMRLDRPPSRQKNNSSKVYVIEFQALEEEEGFKHFGYMDKLFKTKESAAEWYESVCGSFMRSMGKDQDWCSDWGPNSKLRCVLRRFHMEHCNMTEEDAVARLKADDKKIEVKH